MRGIGTFFMGNPSDDSFLTVFWSLCCERYVCTSISVSHVGKNFFNLCKISPAITIIIMYLINQSIIHLRVSCCLLVSWFSLVAIVVLALLLEEFCGSTLEPLLLRTELLNNLKYQFY